VRAFAERQRNVLIGGRYDAPLWRDPLSWLAGLALLAIINQQIKSIQGETGLAAAIDFVYPFLIQFAIFGLVPTSIRRRIRRRRLEAQR